MICERSDYHLFSENLIIVQDRKEQYGEINTPFYFIEEMFDTLPEHLFENPELHWLDPGSGHGNFSICLYFRLMKGLEKFIHDPTLRSKYIIKNMLFMVEINKENVISLRLIFGTEANIFSGNYLEMSKETFNNQSIDVIIGNPPFNINGLIKVPTNSTRSKKTDGQTAWTHFVRQNLNLLVIGGFMNIIIPSIWMKPDKEHIYNLFTQHKIHKIRCLSNTDTNKLFSYGAQTPTCYLTLEKTLPSSNVSTKIDIYDEICKDFIPIQLKPNMPIALHGWSILKKILPFCEKYGRLSDIIIKTNMPPLKSILSTTQDSILFPYPNIHTCHLQKNQPSLVVKYSNMELPFANQPKLILAHKMYGFPYIDETGEYGISNRDNYIIINQSIPQLQKIQEGLNYKLILFIMTTTRYRMKYLERYAFYYLPNFANMKNVVCDFYEKINITEKEWIYINNEIKKEYLFFTPSVS